MKNEIEALDKLAKKIEDMEGKKIDFPVDGYDGEFSWYVGVDLKADLSDFFDAVEEANGVNIGNGVYIEHDFENNTSHCEVASLNTEHASIGLYFDKIKETEDRIYLEIVSVSTGYTIEDNEEV